MKSCTKCGERKPLAEFNQDRKARDGHQSQCRGCQTLGNKRRRNSVGWRGPVGRVRGVRL